MKPRRSNLRRLTVAGVAVGMFFAAAQGATAQNTRYLDRRVAAGKQMEFQWLNYDERTCKDRGYPKLIVNSKPSLGSYRTKRRKFTQQNGRCKGKKLSVLLVYYVAGRKKGSDRSSFTIRGSSDIRIHLKAQVY